MYAFKKLTIEHYTIPFFHSWYQNGYFQFFFKIFLIKDFCFLLQGEDKKKTLLQMCDLMNVSTFYDK